MPKDATRFYNMLIHLIKGNKLFEENVAIKNIWQKDGNTFFDIYFYRHQKSYIFDAVFIHDILDLTNEKAYKDITAFVEDFFADEEDEAEEIDEEKLPEPSLTIDKNIFQPIYLDLVIMSFMAHVLPDKIMVKKRIMSEYIKKCIPSTERLSEQYLDDYLNSLEPSEEEFYAALQAINVKKEEDVEFLSRELIKVCLTDGRLHYMEKMYLAEFMQVLREHGVQVDLGF